MNQSIYDPEIRRRQLDAITNFFLRGEKKHIHNCGSIPTDNRGGWGWGVEK